MLKSKKGFSLVELTIVIAIVAVVVTMVCGFMITYRKHTYQIAETTDSVSDINRLKDTVNSFIMRNDNSTTEFKADGNTLSAGSEKLTFDKNTKKLNDVAFDTVSNCTFSFREDVIVCTVTIAKGKYSSDKTKSVELIFNTFAYKHAGTS